MHRLRKLAVSTAVAATAALAVTMAPAHADPINSAGKAVTPQPYDIVSVGANTDENLFNQLSLDYNATTPATKHGPSHPYLYTWNATGTANIITKAGCAGPTKKGIQRPNGSGAGLKALDNNATTATKPSYYCIDFDRSSSGRSSSSPPDAPGGVTYVALAKDAVTYASRDVGATKTVPATYVPKGLTIAQLTSIFNCTVTNWKQVGGPNQPIHAYLPQSGSGTLTFWLTKLGLKNAGSCVSDVDANKLPLEENQGQSSVFNDPNAIFIYSVGDWIAQKYHSAACTGAKPTKTQNKFGCDQTKYLGLDPVKVGSKIYSPLTTAKVPTINATFTATGLTRTIYDVLRYVKVTKTTPDHIAAQYEPIFAPKARHGYLCSSLVATAAIKSYGFLTVPNCGNGS
jgi:ABC-type phosphate transport system substrate-binding protein